jgi:hypothetical protein
MIGKISRYINLFLCEVPCCACVFLTIAMCVNQITEYALVEQISVAKLVFTPSAEQKVISKKVKCGCLIAYSVKSVLNGHY